MSSDLFILSEDGNTPVKEGDIFKWSKWTSDHWNKRRVAQTQVANKIVSTVFLGLDHSWGDGPPLLWETMVFPDNEEMDRCTGNREQASAMHLKMVKKVISEARSEEQEQQKWQDLERE